MPHTWLGAAIAFLFSCTAFPKLADPALGDRGDFPEVAQLPVQTSLPDPLMMFHGQRVTTREQWIQERRPELKALIQHYEYGYFLPTPAKMDVTLEREDHQAIGGKATLKLVTLSFGPPDVARIHLLLVVPNHRKGPAPVFVGTNGCGNYMLVKDNSVPLPTCWLRDICPGAKDNRATEAGRGAQFDDWAIDQTIARGYAIVAFHTADVDIDRPDVYEGIHQHFPKTTPNPRNRGTLAAWAWGIHRVVDYLYENPDIDKRRIAVVGHSRRGKTALLAAAFDERIALVIPHQSGSGGTSLWRGDIKETVEVATKGSSHWSNGRFKEFSKQVERLPFDQHCLIALVAPRPVLCTTAVEDPFAFPKEEFRGMQAADPVYRFLGAGGLDAKTMPPLGTLSDGTLGFYVRPGAHSMTRDDWKVFLDFADKHLGKPEGHTAFPR